MPIASINPATEETLRTFEPLTEPQIEDKLRLATETFPVYRRLPFAVPFRCRVRWRVSRAIP